MQNIIDELKESFEMVTNIAVKFINLYENEIGNDENFRWFSRYTEALDGAVIGFDMTLNAINAGIQKPAEQIEDHNGISEDTTIERKLIMNEIEFSACEKIKDVLDGFSRDYDLVKLYHSLKEVYDENGRFLPEHKRIAVECHLITLKQAVECDRERMEKLCEALNVGETGQKMDKHDAMTKAENMRNDLEAMEKRHYLALRGFYNGWKNNNENAQKHSEQFIEKYSEQISEAKDNLMTLLKMYLNEDEILKFFFKEM